MRIRLYANLRDAAGKRAVQIPLSEGTRVSDVIRALMTRVPNLAPLILDEEGELAPHIAVVVDGRDIRHLQGLETVVRDENQMDIFPPVGGGTSSEKVVSVRFAGDLHSRVGPGVHRVRFGGRTLRDLMAVLLREYEIQDLVRDEQGIKPSVQVAVDGRLAYTIGGWDAQIDHGATICIFSFGGALLPVDLPEGTRMRELGHK
jgi:molybdopterin synthase sulfur carrier subunit